jgi:hypothetical protein
MRRRVLAVLTLLLLTVGTLSATLTSVKGGIPFPAWPTTWSGGPSIGALLVIDAASEKAATIFACTSAKAVHKVYVRTATVATGDTVDVRIETVDSAANGDPTGTLWAANTNASLVIASSDDNVWKLATLTADATCTVGSVMAVVVVNGGAGGNIIIGSNSDSGSNFPYGDLYTGSWAKQIAIPLIVVEYSDGTYEPLFGMTDTGGPVNTNTFNSGSATNRRGNIFQVGFPTRVKGCWTWVDADGDYTCTLYDSAGTSILATTATINNFQRQATSAGIQVFPFLATANLSASTNYRIAIVPTTVTNLSTHDFDVPTAPMLDMFPGGQSMFATTYTSSAWVDTATTRRAYLGVILDAFDNGASGTGRRRIIGQ